MNHADYETLVRNLLQELTKAAHQLGQCEIGGGASNRIKGASGFPHQIDASVCSPSKLLLVECKYWTDPVDVEPVLVLASRMADIRSNFPGVAVHGSIVSTQETTSGAKALAGHFGISIDIVNNPREYAVRIFNQVFIGIHDVLRATDFMTFEVIKSGK